MEYPWNINLILFPFMMLATRVGALVMTLPMMAGQFVPMRARLFLTLGISIVGFPMISQYTQFDIQKLNVAEMFLIFSQQILIGICFSFVVQILFQAFSMAAEACAMQMGLGFASMVDPLSGVSVPTLSQFYIMLVSLLFLSFNGHLYIMQAIMESFHRFPLGVLDLRVFDLASVIQTSRWIFIHGFQIALPAITAILMVNITISIMTRATPQLNIFSIGFPITMILGFIIIWFMTGTILPGFQSLSDRIITFLHGWGY